MDDITFNSLEDLYKRVEPALKTRKEEFNLTKFSQIKEIDIWNYLTYKWQTDTGLSLYQMVDDIMTCNPIKVLEYKNKEEE